MGIKKATAEPQLCGNFKSSHREHHQFPSLSIRKQWQPGDLQKIGLKIPAPKIFAIVLAFLTWLGRHLLWNCCSVRITGLKWNLQMRDAFFFWEISEEVPKNTSCRKLSCHKKLKLPGASTGCRYFLPRSSARSSKAAASFSLPAEIDPKYPESRKLQNLH